MVGQAFAFVWMHGDSEVELPSQLYQFLEHQYVIAFRTVTSGSAPLVPEVRLLQIRRMRRPSIPHLLIGTTTLYRSEQSHMTPPLILRPPHMPGLLG